jgi:hypothetical protein
MTNHARHAEAAVAVARRMTVAILFHNRTELSLGTYGLAAITSNSCSYPSIEAALWDIAAGAITFGDLCDDNIYLHECLSQRGLISLNVEVTMHTQSEINTWNAVADLLPWAAEEILKERIRQHPEVRDVWKYRCCACAVPLREDDMVFDPDLPGSGLGGFRREDRRFCRGCHEVQIRVDAIHK